MHELGITRNLVSLVAEAAQGRRVHRVWLEIGTRTALLPESVRFCFDVVRQGTVLETAELEIAAVAPGWSCEGCSATVAEDGEAVPAPCGHCGTTRWRRRTGDELNVKAMEVE
jgi:hydrogenase nickel incorporation protein HypA/HybF